MIMIIPLIMFAVLGILCFDFSFFVIIPTAIEWIKLGDVFDGVGYMVSGVVMSIIGIICFWFVGAIGSGLLIC